MPQIGLQPCQYILELLIIASNRCGCRSGAIKQQEVDKFSRSPIMALYSSQKILIVPMQWLPFIFPFSDLYLYFPSIVDNVSLRKAHLFPREKYTPLARIKQWAKMRGEERRGEWHRVSETSSGFFCFLKWSHFISHSQKLNQNTGLDSA